MQTDSALGSKDKLVIAMAAAMGGGCRVCAERLFGMAEAAGVAQEESASAFWEGLETRRCATETMREKAAALVGEERLPVSGADRARFAPRLEALSRLAAAAAAGSAPDAARFMETARRAGAAEPEIRTALGIARTVRAKAHGFSDGEIDELHGKRLSVADALKCTPENAASVPCENPPGAAACCGAAASHGTLGSGVCCG